MPEISVNESKFLGLTREEFDAEYKRCKQSPVYFITNYILISYKEGGHPQPFRFKRVQKMVYKILKEKFWKPFEEIDGEIYYNFQQIRLIIVKYRQVGISTLIIALVIWMCIFWHGTRALITLHKQKYSQKMLQRLIDMFESIDPMFRPVYAKEDRDNMSEFSLSSVKSSISVTTPGQTKETADDQARSENYQFVMISEFSRYRHQQEFLGAVMPAVKKGNAIIESTPSESGDLYHGLFMGGINGTNEWESVFYAWFEDEENQLPIDSDEERQHIQDTLTPTELELFEKNPGMMSLEKIKWRRYTIINDCFEDERLFQREYPEDIETAFSKTDSNIFDDPEFDIRQITTPYIITDRNLIGEPPKPGRLYVMGVDCAKGLGGKNDYNLISVGDPIEKKQVFQWRSNVLSYRLMPQKIYSIYQEYPSLMGIESNGIGETVLNTLRTSDEFMADKLFQRLIYRTSHKQDGFFTGSNKEQFINRLYVAMKAAVRTYLIQNLNPQEPAGFRFASKILMEETGTFIRLADGTLGSMPGSGFHDDSVIGNAIMLEMVRFYKKFLKIYQEETGYGTEIESSEKPDPGERRVYLPFDQYDEDDLDEQIPDGYVRSRRSILSNDLSNMGGYCS